MAHMHCMQNCGLYWTFELLWYIVFSFLNIAMTLSPSLCYQLLRSFKIIQTIYFWQIRLVVFILACFLKFATTLEILVHWITL